MVTIVLCLATFVFAMGLAAKLPTELFAPGDQARIATPEQALADGADLLVIGRPITGAPDPAQAAEAIAASLAGNANA